MRRGKQRPGSLLLAIVLCGGVLGSGAVLCRANTGLLPGLAAAAGGFLASPAAGLQTAAALADQAANSPEDADGLTLYEGPASTALATPLPSDAPSTAAPATQSPAQEQPGPTAPAGAGAVETVQYAQGSGNGYVACGASSLKNTTNLQDSEVAALLAEGCMPFAIEANSAEPQVLILHTHATECYEDSDGTWYDPASTCRSTDNTRNMVAVGEEMAAVLNAAGIHTLHDATLHDYPSYNGSYAKSNATAQAYLEAYPSIKVILDVHRDAIERENGTRVRPLVSTAEGDAAQVMLICGCDKGGNLPNYPQNLRFAAAWQARMEQNTPGLARPLMFAYRYYNQDLTTGSLLIEVGGHANTLPEAKRAGRLAAAALADLLLNVG